MLIHEETLETLTNVCHDLCPVTWHCITRSWTNDVTIWTQTGFIKLSSPSSRVVGEERLHNNYRRRVEIN